MQRFLNDMFPAFVLCGSFVLGAIAMAIVELLVKFLTKER